MSSAELIVELPGDLDWSLLTLDQTEGFLLSRVSGPTSTSDLSAMTGLPNEQVRSIVISLIKKSALLLTDGDLGAAVSAKGQPKANTNPYEGFVFTPADLAAPCDIDDKQKKRILFFFGNLEKWNHYALLGLKRTATDKDIKKGYFKASKEFHPDAYFRRDLGIYKKKIESIFKAMKAAYDVLRKPKMRAAYDETMPAASFSPEELAELRRIAAETRSREEEKKQAKARALRLESRKKELRLRRNPMFERIKQGVEMVVLAEAALEKKRYSEASRHAKLAIEYARGHESVKSRAEPVLQKASAAIAKVIAKDALGSVLDEEEMRAAVTKFLELAPDDPERLLDATKLMIQLESPAEAMRHAQRATKFAQDDIKAWQIMLELAEQLEHWNTALKATNALVRLEPENQEFKQKQKQIRKLCK